MNTVTFFNSEEELQQLTGLNHQELWDNCFDLDDWDWGFVSDVHLNPYDYKNNYVYWLLNHMHNYYTGYKVTYYDNKYYYILYHS